MINNITADDVKRMTDAEGLILQGCGGDPQEWLDGINEALTEVGILMNGGAFKDIYVFEHDGLNNILFPFAGMNPDDLNVGKLAMWRLQTHDAFAGTWLSDYLPNRFGVIKDEPEWTIRVKHVYSGENNERLSEVVCFPTQHDRIDHFAKNAVVDGAHDRVFFMERFESVIPGLGKALPEHIGADEINRLAQSIRTMSEVEREKFTAFIGDHPQFENYDNLIDIAENIGDPEYKPFISPIQVFIGNVHDARIGGFTMPLPATIEEMHPFFASNEITGWQDMEIIEVISAIDILGEVLSETIKATMSPDALDELNYLAAKIAAMDNNEHALFSAALEAKRHCRDITEIINLTENLGRFDLQPGYSEEQYGGFLLDMEKDNTLAVFDKLNNSTDADDRYFAQYVQRLEAHIDTKSFGLEAVEKENGVFTAHGYLTEFGGEYKEVYHGSQDIPSEHRLFTQPGEITKPLMKLDDVDIAATIMKLHAVCFGNMDFASDSLKKLIKGHDRDYLLLADSSEVCFFPAIEAYKRGTEAFEQTSYLTKYPAEGSDTKAFAIRVGSRGNDVATGDLIELNVKALCANITRHAAVPDRIDAVFSNYAKISYDLWSWADIPTYAREDVRSYEVHFADDGLAEAARRYASFTSVNEMSSEAVGMDVFLTEVNAAYMAAAEHQRPGMIRIANEAAKEILAQGATDVYKLTPDGAQKLSPIEAMRPLVFAEHRELAIEQADISSLDKWAERAVKNTLRKKERDQHSKAKNKGEEL